VARAVREEWPAELPLFVRISATGQADVMLLGRQMLRDPYWPLHAAKALNVNTPWPNQYLGAK